MPVNARKLEDPAASKGERATVPSRLPLFVSLDQRRVVVVGGGTVAASKLSSLLSAGASVTLVAPKVVPEAVVAGVTIHRRSFRERDLDGAWFVVAAATPGVNAKVARAAARRRIFVNAVDDPDNASAFFAGVVNRGGIAVAISSSGCAPGLVRLLRESIDDLLPQDLNAWVDMARSERQKWLRQRVKVADRVPLLAAAIGRLYATE
jgi:uroporphyrin-III C-methyltransferase/precorrin-2 dehydrogenase/sirohydrochlorin ferrochelatase